MARIRTIKPEFFTSLTLADLTVHERMTFIALWTYVDDEGRGKCDSRLVKAAAWSLDDSVSAEDVDGYLYSLERAGLIQVYEVGGRSFLQVSGWAEHQKISHPTPSRLPPMEPSGEVPENLPSPQETFAPERNREQGKERIDVHFDEWWKAAPRKQGKGDARRAYASALGRATPEELLAGITAYAATRKGEPSQYTKMPGPWLRADRWLDEAPPEDEAPHYFDPEVDL